MGAALSSPGTQTGTLGQNVATNLVHVALGHGLMAELQVKIEKVVNLCALVLKVFRASLSSNRLEISLKNNVGEGLKANEAQAHSNVSLLFSGETLLSFLPVITTPA